MAKVMICDLEKPKCLLRYNLVTRSEICFVFAVLLTVHLWGLLTIAKIFLLFVLVQIVYSYFNYQEEKLKRSSSSVVLVRTV